MSKVLLTGLVLALLASIGPAVAEQRVCAADELDKKVAQCGGYVVWINRGKDGCSYGFKGDRLFCGTKNGYLACEQEAQRLRCRRPLGNQ